MGITKNTFGFQSSTYFTNFLSSFRVSSKEK